MAQDHNNNKVCRMQQAHGWNKRHCAMHVAEAWSRVGHNFPCFHCYSVAAAVSKKPKTGQKMQLTLFDLIVQVCGSHQHGAKHTSMKPVFDDNVDPQERRQVDPACQACKRQDAFEVACQHAGLVRTRCATRQRESNAKEENVVRSEKGYNEGRPAGDTWICAGSI